jgi:uncharacterized protein (TIGR00266 family)
MEYTIIGDDMQALKIQLQPGEEIYAEAGAMLFMSEGIQLDSQMKGGILGGLARKFLAGESLFLSVFRANQPAQLALAAPTMGKIFPIELKGDTILAERNAYLCSVGNVDLSVAFTRKLGAGLFGGEGFILQKISGHGLVFLHAGGTMMQFDLNPDERLRVDTGCIVSMASTVSYDIQYVGGIKNALFGGEGLFFATLQGPGHVTLQTLPFSRLADRIKMAIGANKGEARGPAGFNVLGDLISGKK